MIRQFFQTIYEPADIVEIRCLQRATVAAKKCWTQASAIGELLPELQKLNSQGFDIYTGANPRKGRGLSGNENTLLARCLFADFDHLPDDIGHGDYVLQKLDDAGLPLPTMVVNSGHGIHTYFRLAEPIQDLSRFTNLQKRLAAKLGSDPAICNSERIMRLPGFTNWKPPKAESFIVECEPARVYEIGIFETLPEIAVAKTEPIAPAVKTQNREAEQVLLRAKLCATKFEPKSRGERNQYANQKAAYLREKFPIDEFQVFEILRDWNQQNPEPLDDNELRTAVANAFRYAKKPAASGNTPPRQNQQIDFIEPSNADDPSGELQDYFDGIISGRIYDIAWPFPMLTELSQSLLSGSVCVFCGCPGASKSLFMIQAALQWLAQNIRLAIFALEDERPKHLQRALAQLAENSLLTKTDWIKNHPDAVRSAMQEYKTEIDRFAKILFTSKTQPAHEQINDWIKQRCDAGDRILIVDPLTAAAQSKEPWIIDNQFLMQAKRIVGDAGASLILVVHPTKNFASVDLGQIAGGAAYERFSHSVFWLEKHNELKTSEIKTPLGSYTAEHNRTLHLLKCRNGAGSGWRLGFEFAGNNLLQKELGTITKKQKGKCNE